MINLIPNEEKKSKVKDFYFRLLVTSFMVVAVSMLVASAAILPAFFFSLVKKNLTDSKLAAQKSEPLPALDQKTLDEVKDLNTKLNLVEKTQKNKYSISQKIINEIVAEKMSDIKITQILYQSDPAKGKTVTIGGTASSRERLLLFKQTLADNVAFKKVDLPISNFVKGSDIKFSINLVPA
ncbi:MAG: hypothetical protein V4486_00470 [Patescibacteria group bacterium]